MPNTKPNWHSWEFGLRTTVKTPGRQISLNEQLHNIAWPIVTFNVKLDFPFALSLQGHDKGYSFFYILLFVYEVTYTCISNLRGSCHFSRIYIKIKISILSCSHDKPLLATYLSYIIVFKSCSIYPKQVFGSNINELITKVWSDIIITEESRTGFPQNHVLNTQCEAISFFNGPLTRYVILCVAHAPGMSGTLSLPLPSKETAS